MLFFKQAYRIESAFSSHICLQERESSLWSFLLVVLLWSHVFTSVSLCCFSMYMTAQACWKSAMTLWSSSIFLWLVSRSLLSLCVSMLWLYIIFSAVKCSVCVFCVPEIFICFSVIIHKLLIFVLSPFMFTYYPYFCFSLCMLSSA